MVVLVVFLLHLIISMVLLALVIEVATSRLGIPRSGVELDTTFISTVGPLLNNHNSLPSGHAGTASLLAGLSEE